MRLKKVEMQGFKSFADKMEIKFKDGITAIVGPNGSGKSNISDAIRWVLGEQSVKTLRGSKMEDIIFSGTDKRKAVGYTEVTMTFDNSLGNIPLDYEEVAITRRMFRSGESEYYLNKNSCRLRDVRELFMDTGVGKDGYSIIGQGRIEEILSNRPEDRRNIFEEAAGIVKYKTKKDEAEKKLEKTEENLIRIKDLVYELSSQAEVLEEQSKKANHFSSLFNKLKEIEVNLFVNDINKATSTIEELNNEIGDLEEKLESNLLEKESIEGKFNILKINTEEIDEDIESFRNEEMNIRKNIDENKNKINILREKETFYNKDLERIKTEKTNLELQLEDLTKTNLITKEKLLKHEEEYRDLFADYKLQAIELDEKIKGLKEKEDLIESNKNNIVKTYNKSSDTRSELNSIVAFNDNIEKRTFQLNKEIREMIVERDSKLEKHKELLGDEDELIKKLSLLKENLNNLKNRELDNINTKELISKKINNKNAELQGKTSSLNVFRNMEKAYEGYYRGVKSILKASKKDPRLEKGLVGVVAELIKVDEKFEKAIDTALGSSAQNIVTKTEEDAKVIIEYLKTNKLGRITCLPLNVIKGNTLKFSLMEREEFQILGLGSEIIEYAEEHMNIFKYLLGRTIIVKDIDYGIRLANKYKHSYRIVTLNGEVLNPGGSMTGGSYASNSINIINRKNRIEKLSKEVLLLRNEQKELLEEEKNILEILKSNKNEILKAEELIKNLDYSIINTKNNKDNQVLELSRLEESIKKSEKEISTLGQEEDSYKIKKEELKILLVELENKSSQLKDETSQLTIGFNEEKVRINEINNMVTEMKINLNTKSDKIKNLKEKLSRDLIELESLNQQIKDREDLMVLNKKEIEEMGNLNQELVRVIEELDIIKSKTKNKLENLMEKKKEFMKSFYSRQEDLKVVNKVISNIEKQKNSQEVKLARTSVQLETYEKKLKEDYELTYDEALIYQKESINIQESIVECRRLKIQIKELGTVNLSSIEEYKRIKTRLDFILEQENDLTTAKEDLRKVIQDMEIKMEKQFLLSFEEINKNFKEVFKVLFDGGQAELNLEDKEEVLSTGIEIKAQPPGKKLQNLTLLSGGEKSLTAVALLFAILRMKPAPFCVLDEIDASLDEANITRYTDYLKTFCQDTQFIIITHRKTTMEMADILYGVTMEEEGISKLISIELKDNVDEIAS